MNIKWIQVERLVIIQWNISKLYILSHTHKHMRTRAREKAVAKRQTEDIYTEIETERSDDVYEIHASPAGGFDFHFMLGI